MPQIIQGRIFSPIPFLPEHFRLSKCKSKSTSKSSQPKQKCGIDESTLPKNVECDIPIMNSEKEKPLQGVAEQSNLINYSKEKSILKSFDKVQAQTDDHSKINQILENNSIPQTSGIFSNHTIDNCSEIFLEPASDDSEDEDDGLNNVVVHDAIIALRQ